MLIKNIIKIIKNNKKYFLFKKVILLKQNGQAFLEAVFAIAIGIIFLLTSAIALSSYQILKQRTAYISEGIKIGGESLKKIKAVSEAHWSKLDSLNKGSGARYYLQVNSNSFVAVSGDEYILKNNVPRTSSKPLLRPALENG